MKRQFLEYFRCPAAFVDFRLSEDLGARPGFFRFGPDLICYGRSASAKAPRDPSASLEDALSRTKVENNTACLPFDLDEIVDNLRHERYTSVVLRPPSRSAPRGVARKTYYAMRPLLPTSLRKHLQRFALRGWDQTPFPAWPIDQTVDRLFDRMMALVIRANSGERVPFIWFWPDGLSSCAVVTHDVETSAGRDFCGCLMDIDDSYAIKSSFQIIPEGRYDVTDEFLNTIKSRGFEINVHDFNHDGDLFENRQEFLRRVARINAYGKRFEAAGYRSGVLYRNLEWYDSFNYSYDMSVPNVGHLDPQPGGCCTIKPYFIGGILEIPVIATQDYTLFHILRQYSTDLWERQIEMVLAGNGLISFIVHPDYLVHVKAREVYVALLSRLSRLRQDFNMWIPLPRDLNEWWRSRNEMRLIRENDSWRIDGPSKHRARIAYANLEDDRVVYSFDPEPSVNALPDLDITQSEAQPDQTLKIAL